MTNSGPTRRWLHAAGGAAFLAALTATAPLAGAQDAPAVAQSSADQAATLDLRTAPKLPNPPVPQGVVFNRPTMPMADYLAAQRRPVGTKPADEAAAAATAPGTALSLYYQTTSINETLFGGFPPDGDIATGRHFTVQIVNYGVTIYNLDSGTLAEQVSFATFFGDNTSFLFDPRAIYDPVWQRFVVMADGCNPCSGAGTSSFFKVAISQTSDPTGAYFIYTVGTGSAPGDFADFPQLGMDLNSLIFTYNDFLANGNFSDARTFAHPKAYLYNGLGSFAPVFGGSGCTVAPPYVLDNHGPTFTLAACPNDNGISLGAMTNSGLTNVALNQWQAKIPVTAYTSPPCAPQPGVNYCLDTSDARFENRSLQVGTRILNVHTITDGTATPQWYEFDTSGNSLLGSAKWFATNTSSDWHPSIVANTLGVTGSQVVGETFGTWMSVDATKNSNLQLRAIGGPGDTVSPPSAGLGAGIPVGPASAQPLTNQTFNGNRSGDYSYISLYPGPVGSCLANEFAVLEGEVSLGTNWGTRIGIVKHC
jgi:hypothetical protein